MITTDYTTDPEYLAILRRILETPADDAPRLILSDWLEDHDQNERAEFIRIQCRIAKLQEQCNCGLCVKLRGGGQHHNGKCAVDQDRDELSDGTSRQSYLRMKEWELCGPHEVGAWGKNLWQWFIKEFDGMTSSPYGPVIRRGFIEEVSLTMRNFIGYECDSCGGTGYGPGEDDLRDVEVRDGCNKCYGDSFIEGVAQKLFKNHPITKVNLVCRDPSPPGMAIGWIDFGTTQDVIDPSIYELIKEIEPDEDEEEYIWKRFLTVEDANKALSDACVSYGRQLAGLNT